MSKTKQKNERSDSIRTSENEGAEGKMRKIKPSYIIIAVLIIALIGALVYMFWPESQEEVEQRGTTTSGSGRLLTLDNLDDVRQRMSEFSADAQYTVSMTTNWVFDTARTPSRNAVVDNLVRNSRTVYFDVIINSTDEVVFSSPYIPLGETLENFALDKDVSPGVYDATVRYFLVDDNNEVVADVAVSVTLTING